MGIGIGNQAKPALAQKSQSNDPIDSLYRQREGLTKQLEAIKSRPKNSQTEQNAAVAQKNMLEKQIATLDQKIQKTSQSMNKQAAIQTNSSSLQPATSENQMPLRLQETGRLLNTYA